MPDTDLWRQIRVAAHDWSEDPPTGDIDQLDAQVREFADRCGFTLDRTTLEAVLFGLANVIGIGCVFDDDEGVETDGYPTDESLAAAVVVAKYIVVKRLEALES